MPAPHGVISRTFRLPCRRVPRALAADVRVREAWAWSMYDFANSGYTTVVITAVFGAYFVGVVAGGKALGDFRLDRGAFRLLRR